MPSNGACQWSSFGFNGTPAFGSATFPAPPIQHTRNSSFADMIVMTSLNLHTFEDLTSDTRSSWLSLSYHITQPRSRPRLRTPQHRQATRSRVFNGSTVQPGRVITRAERERRQLSTGLSAYQDEYTFGYLWRKVKHSAQPYPIKVIDKLRTHLAPDTSAGFSDIAIQGYTDLRNHWQPYPLRPYILASIFFLIVFGSLNVVTTYLLNLSRANGQCSPLISYIPVTYTVTQYVTPSISTSVQPAATTIFATSTSTRTLTVVMSQVSQVTSASDPITANSIFSYVVESGTTSWFNGVSPSSGQRLVTVTSTIYMHSSSVTPASIEPASVMPASLTLDTATLYPPPYVSTTYSAPDSDTTITTTTTRFTTTTVPNVVTLTRSSFTPIGSAGWNSTMSNIVGGTEFRHQLVSGVPTTVTGTIYWSTGTKITSTSFTTLTTTLTDSLMNTLTLTPVTSSSSVQSATASGSGSDTSLTSASDPVTSSTVLVAPAATTSPIAWSIVPASYGGFPEPSSSEIQVSPITASTTSTSQLTTLATSTIAGSSNSGVVAASQVSSSSTGSQTRSSSIADSSSLTVANSASSLMFTTATGTTAPSSVSGTSVSLSSISGIPASSAPVFSPIPYGTFSQPVPSSSLAISPTNASSSQTVYSTLATSSSGVTQLPATSSASVQASASVTGSSSSGGPEYATSASSVNGPSTSSAVTGGTATNSASMSTSLISTATSSDASTSAQSSSSSQPSSTSSTPSTTAASSTISTASPTPSVCGEHGNFTMTFDDLPNFSTSDVNNTDITQAPPIFNGYHHFAFSNGYVYAPPPSDPFTPHSSPHLAVFLGNASGNGSDNTPSAMAPTSGMIRPGEFGDGSVAPVSAYWFNAYNVWLGCDNPGPEPCTYVVTAYAWNAATSNEQQVTTENVTTPGCPGLHDCQLQQVTFPSSFNGLSGLQIQAYRGQDQVMFFMDDVSMGWYNNTCAAGLQRLRSPRGSFKR
ncbi:hypothetical protein AMS68_001848 [Peltaster fructicola]|uniref:DUF7371 domain-containing protein n=1 Tax=Peltaster fructicola TaxID=286661 RepID=A0A6H0XNU9_9PEZI|nr:hypothetical protein AMS68_001848 [Peltaster fructicola]